MKKIKTRQKQKVKSFRRAARAKKNVSPGGFVIREISPRASRRMVDIIFARLCRLLSDNEFDIIINTHVDPFAGFVDYDKNKIYLNPNQYTVVETLIHELLHILKPKADEKTVIEMTGLIFDGLTDSQKGQLWSYIDALTTRCIGVTRKELVGAR